ncbi:MAG: hypothetical protein IJQ35_05050 [Bacteroidales bacterium]|nr:hypothetical protein [Bacteroidales bacterium]
MKRNIQSVFLLSVILPIFLFAPFHHHHQADTALSCHDCVADQHHSGHITDGGTLSECLVCHFMGLACLPVPSQHVSSFTLHLQDCEQYISPARVDATPRHNASRAPPVSSCFIFPFI